MANCHIISPGTTLPEETLHGACLSGYTPTSSELGSYLCSPLCHGVGEQVLANATKVIRLLPLVRDNPVAAVDGDMVCSNYRLQFIPDKKSIAGDINEETLNDSQSIPLLSILSVIKVSKEKGKRKPLTAKNSTKKAVEEVEIITKDLKRMHFDMTQCDRRQVSVMVNTIVVYSQPTSVSQLFINDTARHSVQLAEPCSIPSFLTVQDWENEMSRLKTVGWRVTSCNHDFSLSMSMPPFLVVPTTITDTSLYYIRALHNQQRLPVWCWSHPVTGAALLRSSGPAKDDEGIPSDAGYLWAISMAKHEGQQVNCKAVLPLDVGKECCSARDIQSSFAKLLDIVIPGSVSELAAADKKWLSGVEATKWLEYVRSCLSVAERASKAIAQERQSVLLFETEGRDVTCVVSSLTQIMLDPTLRTIAGLEALIQKEWVAMGHPFASRHKMVSAPNSKDELEGFSPVFLLFLDCVFQLMSQCLSSFEFSETHLISLYDASLSGLYSTFLFNSPREFFAAKNPYKTDASSFAAHSVDYHSVLPQAWGRWMDVLPPDVRERCYNPFHFLFAHHRPQKASSVSTPVTEDNPTSTVLDISPSDLVQGGSLGLYTSCLAHQQVSDRQRRRSRHDSWVITPTANEGSENLLLPQTMQCHLKFWTGVFFRFVPISNEPFKEVIRVEDLKGQLVRKARHYKDSLKEQELKNWRYRHTMSFIGDSPLFEHSEPPPALLVRSGSASEPCTTSDSLTDLPQFFAATREVLNPSRDPIPTRHSPSPSHHGHGSSPQHFLDPAHHGLGSSPHHSPRPAHHGHGSPGPPKPPRPISKTTVNVQVKGASLLPGDNDSGIQLCHMTPISPGTGHSNGDPPPSIPPLGAGRRTKRDSHGMNSWITESEEVDAL